ncbi:LamG-like jellyroll fold domain-containing protein [Porphyromonas loveana]|uniref:LamG-like jellyroll fold domain-containing protein n=1 Tax=Porphyromonas loveana TaxID=1884669 RepID=UPI0035A13C9E
MEDGIILNIPFDESRGSLLAFDYSPTRADLQVNSATFVRGKNGNAIKLDGTNIVLPSKDVFSNLNGDFTVSMYIKPTMITTGHPKNLIWVLNFDGFNNYKEVFIDAQPEMWLHIAMARSGGRYEFYADGQFVASYSVTDRLVGVSISQDYYGGSYGLGLVDDLKIYDRALTQQEIMDKMDRDRGTQKYSINGIDFKDYGVFVSGSDGILSRPKLKRMATISWDNYHGEDVDLKHKYYEPREITLSCFIKADSKAEFMMRVSEFERVFDVAGLQRLVVDVHPTKPLIYEVYCKDEIAVSKVWSSGTMVGVFKLKLIEPQPVKRVLRHIRVSEATKSCTINITTPKCVNIFWGDGTVDEDVLGRSVSISHNYQKDGEYFPVITGCIDEIEEFQTNAIIVWNKL